MVLRPSKSVSKGADPPFEDSEPNAAHLCRLLRLTKRHLPPTMALAQHRIMILEASLFYRFGARMPYVEDILHVTLHVPKLPYLCGPCHCNIRHCKCGSMPGKRRTALKRFGFRRRAGRGLGPKHSVRYLAGSWECQQDVRRVGALLVKRRLSARARLPVRLIHSTRP